jgi:hypothetical protein
MFFSPFSAPRKQGDGIAAPRLKVLPTADLDPRTLQIYLRQVDATPAKRIPVDLGRRILGDLRIIVLTLKKPAAIVASLLLA